ncbi:MAG: hypothetical protein M1819_002376 [Sarea resinae]|nr:MAG: hypothetical protein M1819_002376 [Sarea resinae]
MTMVRRSSRVAAVVASPIASPVKTEPRSTNVKREAPSGDEDEAEGGSRLDVDDDDASAAAPLPMPSFNGQLQRYAYADANTNCSPPKRSRSGTRASETRSQSSPSKRRKLENPSTSPTGATPEPPPSNPPATPKSEMKKKKRASSRYAPPSTYAHLPPLVDVLAPNLICVFIGVNPGIRTAVTGHAYSHPSNLFWKLLHSSGITPRRFLATEDRSLPRLCGLGNTNIVSRPTKDQAELSRAEMVASVGVLEAKIKACRPEAVCIVGKAIWESVWRARFGRAMKKDEFRWGWQDEELNMGAKWAPQGEEEAAAVGALGDDENVAVEGNGSGADDGPEAKSQVVHDSKEKTGHELSNISTSLIPGVANSPYPGARIFVATSTSGLAAHLRPKEKEEIWAPLGEWVRRRRRERGEWLGEV